MHTDLSPLRILHVIPWLGVRAGGTTVATAQLCAALASEGHDVQLASTNLDGRGRWSLGPGRHVLDVPRCVPIAANGYTSIFFPTAWPHRYAFSPTLASWLARTIPTVDIVHISSLYAFTTWWAARCCLRAGVPYLVKPHGSLAPVLRNRGRLKKSVHWSMFERWVVDHAAAVHYTSLQEKLLAESFVRGRPGIVVGNGFDTSEYQTLPCRGSFRRKHPRIGDGPIVLFLGRLHPKKGLDVLVESFAQIAAERPNAWLVIAGPDEGVEAGIHGRIGQLGCANRVIFTGLVEGTAKLELLRDADVWVLPSYNENFGIGVLEALACNLPVVVSDQVALADQLRSAEAALVAPVQARELAASIRQVLERPDLATRLAANGRRLVEEQFSWRPVARQMASEYRRVIETDRFGRVV